MSQFLDGVDPQRTFTVLLTAGPPGMDFSCIRGENAPGVNGPEGQKFEAFADWQKEVAKTLHPRPIKRLVENVLPHRQGDIAHFQNRLDMEAIIFDAAEFKRVSRPRVWWSDISWSHDTIKEVLGEKTTWKKYYGSWKVK